jgi:hypothetical protein
MFTLFTCRPLVPGMSQINPVYVLPSLWGKNDFISLYSDIYTYVLGVGFILQIF